MMFDGNTRLLKLLTKVLNTLQAAIHDQKEAERKDQESRDRAKEPQPQVIINPEVSLPPAVISYIQSQTNEQPAKDRRERIRLRLEFAAVAAAFGLGALTILTFQQVKRQADSAKDQVGIMQKQLIASERPWVSAKISLIQPLAFADNGGTIGVGAIMNNVGHSPALNVRFASKVIMALGATDLHARQVEYCEIWKHRSSIDGLPGNTIFPGGEPLRYSELTGMDSEEIKQGLSKTPIKGMITPTLIACVDYQFYFSEEHHQTWYSYPLGRPDPVHPGAWMGFFVPSGSPQGVVIIPTMMGETAY